MHFKSLAKGVKRPLRFLKVLGNKSKRNNSEPPDEVSKINSVPTSSETVCEVEPEKDVQVRPTVEEVILKEPSEVQCDREHVTEACDGLPPPPLAEELEETIARVHNNSSSVSDSTAQHTQTESGDDKEVIISVPAQINPADIPLPESSTLTLALAPEDVESEPSQPRGLPEYQPQLDLTKPKADTSETHPTLDLLRDPEEIPKVEEPLQTDTFAEAHVLPEVTMDETVNAETGLESQSGVKEESTEQPLEEINPFLIDDPDSEPEHEHSPEPPLSTPHTDSLNSVTSAAHEISLAPSASTPPLEVQTSVDHLPPSNLNKAVPPPPTSDSDTDEINDLYIPALAIPTMFLPIPNTDPLSILLTKYVPEPHLRPPRDLSGEWQHTDFHSLVMTNNWRALARMARDRIVTASASDVPLILGLWYLRLASLARLRLFNQTTAECNNLFAALSAVDPPPLRAYLFDRLLPFELEVMRSRCVYWAGDYMGYLDSLSALLRRCKTKARKARDASEIAMWKERGARLCLIIASQLIEMKDFTAATTLLEPLCSGASSPPALRSAIARIYLQGGHTAMAAHHVSILDADPDVEHSLKAMNAMLMAAADGDWTKMTENANKLLEIDSDNVVAINNLAVALLSQGKLKQGIEVLEGALHSSPSAVTVAEPFLFNISTLYELRSSLSIRQKRDLLVEVAKWSGDGLKTTCLKMPSN